MMACFHSHPGALTHHDVITSIYCIVLALCDDVVRSNLACFTSCNSIHCTGVYWCVLLCTAVYWCVLVCTGVYWCVLVCTGVYWCVLVCTGVYWCVLVCTGVYWCVLVCTGVYWCVLVCTGVYWCVLVCTGVYWCTIAFSRVCSCNTLIEVSEDPLIQVLIRRRMSCSLRSSLYCLVTALLYGGRRIRRASQCV